MQKPSSGISREGFPAIFLVLLFTVVCAFLEAGFLATVGLVLTGFVLNFFRDPARVVPQEDDVAVAPADGRVVKIETMIDPVTEQERTAVCIFMNVFNVHVNRMPVPGTVQAIRYWPGKFFNASLDKASTDNERNAVQLMDNAGLSWTVVQIAGFLARRIVCWAEKGDSFERGQRFGLIKFGSRVDIYLPGEFEAKVLVGEKVLAGQTVIAQKK